MTTLCPTPDTSAKLPVRGRRRRAGAALPVGWRMLVLAGLCLGSLAAQAATLVGSAVVQAGADSNAAGTAEAFLATVGTAGTVAQLSVYLDAGSPASRVVAGLYSDAGGHPGTLLTQGTIAAPVAAAWNAVTVPSATLAAGQLVWMALLSPAGTGRVRFRDGLGSSHSETSSGTKLAGLPSAWSTGVVYADGPLSMIATSAAGSTPLLTVTPASLAFTATAGGANPSAANLSVANGGTGTLAFSAGSGTSWLAITPASGTAPATESVSASIAGLGAGSYSGSVTLTASGVSGSPAVIPVTLTVKSAVPVLSVTPASLSFAATLGAGAPAAQALSIANAGGGTLTFTAASNQAWLTATPASGSAPATASVSASVTGLAAGSYDGQLAITATGATGSPATIPVHLVVSPVAATSADWPMVGQNPARTSYAANDAAIDKTNVASLSLAWSVVLDGKVSAQPLFLGGVAIGGATHDVVIAASNQNSLYALDADAGTLLWNVNFGADAGATWAVPGGLGIRSAPAVDRATNRLFVMSDDGRLRTLSLSTGLALAPPLQIIDLPVTNKVRGGLNLFANKLYIANGSDGGDEAPWRGRVYAVDVSGATPTLAATFDVIPGVAGDNRGGGIWNYGGVSVDPATGNVYAATGADWQSAYTPYAVRMIKLTPSLGLVGTYEPPHPATFACDALPCDVDFSAAPTVFTPTGCPTMVAAGNKDGHLYVMRTNDFATTSTAWQALTLNTADDALKHGGLGGIPAFWPAGNMLYVTDSGDGTGGVPAGVVALSVSAAPACQLSVAWAKALPKLGSTQSSATVVGNVVLVGEGGSGEVHAFDAQTGTELWNSGSTVTGNTYAAPTVGRGKVFVGSWAGTAPSDYGVVRAFGLGTGTGGGCTGTPPAVLAGSSAVLADLDVDPGGLAEAFQVSTATCGKVTSLSVYIDAHSTSGAVVVGLYADNAGHPGMLLTQAAVTAPVSGAWNRVAVPPINVSAATPYWIAVLGTGSGTLALRDVAGGCRSETSASGSLATLPASWATGNVYGTCPASAYAAP
jgi:outer membrane protein assembly factor BamB